MRLSILRGLAALGAAFAFGASAPAGAADVATRLGLPASIHFGAIADQCQNNPGPFITLSGDLTLGGIGGRLIFRNNVKGTHQRIEEVAVDVPLLAAGETIHFAKQPSRGGVGGNPYIFVQFFDGGWKALSSPILLGRCVQGLKPGALLFKELADAALDAVVTGDCSNSPGPEIALEGGVALGALNAKLIFTNNRKGTHLSSSDVVVDLEILPAGQELVFPKQPPLGGVGGNPHIYFQFVNDAGSPLSSEFYLGRCVQLSQ